MFWEYKWIDGVLHFRSDPRADFIEADRQLLTRYATESDEQNRKLRTENERLREALRAFADFSESFHTVADEDDDEDIWFGHDGRFIRCGDIRAARAALEGEG